MIEGLPASKFGDGPCFARVLATAAALGLDGAGFGPRSVLIVGSNGKGTTAAMTAAALTTHRKTGLFTSPHLMSVTERIAINGAPIAMDEMRALSREVAAASVGGMGAFEHLFLMAALAFHRAGCEAIVWEAGIGGRFDPTRLIRARLGALTSLDLEHTALLGDTLFAIGCDKLDGFAPGASVFVGPNAGKVFEDLAAYAALSDKQLLAPSRAEAEAFAHVEAPFLQTNASMALAIGGRTLSESEGAIAAIAATRLPGRLETLSRDPLLVIDIAHTPDAAREALKGFRRACPVGGGLMIGVSQGKKADQIAAILARAFPRIACVAARHAARPAVEITPYVRWANPNARISVHGRVETALRALQDEGGPIFATGSLYLAAEVKALHLGLDPGALWYL